MGTIRFIKVMYKWYRGDYEPKVTKTTDLCMKDRLDVIVGYIRNRIDFLSHLVIAPIVYPIYYIFRNKINNKLFKLIKAKKDINDVYDYERYLYCSLRFGSIYDRNICLDAILDLPCFYRFLWYSGDMLNVATDGNIPDDYKPSLPMFWRRWFYGAIRNPFYNRVFAKYIQGPITEIQEVFDTRGKQEVRSRGIGNHRVGERLRVYRCGRDENFFYYEHTYKLKLLGWRTHYSGVVGISDVEQVSIYPLLVWYEHSNRPCKLIEEKQS